MKMTIKLQQHGAIQMCKLILLGHVALVAQRPMVVKLSRGRSVGLYVRACVRTCVRRSVQCIVEKMADRIRMPFGVIGRKGPGLSQVMGFGDRSTGRGAFGGKFGCAIVTNGDLLSQRRGPVPKLLWTDFLIFIITINDRRRVVGR